MQSLAQSTDFVKVPPMASFDNQGPLDPGEYPTEFKAPPKEALSSATPRGKVSSERAGHGGQAGRNRSGVSVGHSPRSLEERTQEAAIAGGFLLNEQKSGEEVSVYEYIKVAGGDIWELRVRNADNWPLSCSCPVGIRRVRCKHEQLFLDLRAASIPAFTFRAGALCAPPPKSTYEQETLCRNRIDALVRIAARDLLFAALHADEFTGMPEAQGVMEWYAAGPGPNRSLMAELRTTCLDIKMLCEKWMLDHDDTFAHLAQACGETLQAVALRDILVNRLQGQPRAIDRERMRRCVTATLSGFAHVRRIDDPDVRRLLALAEDRCIAWMASIDNVATLWQTYSQGDLGLGYLEAGASR